MVKRKSNRIRLSSGDRVFEGIICVLAAAITLVILYPLWFVLIASVSDPNMLNRGEVLFIPKGLTLLGYQDLFRTSQLWLGYRNTIFYTVAGTAINLVMTICAAYPLSRKDLDGRTAITGMIVFTMFFGGGTIPAYLVNRSLNLIDTPWVLLLPGAINAWNFVVMRSYFQTSIPDELFESARLDGCSDLQYIRSILLPLSMPVIAVMILYYGSGHWNQYFSALLYIRKADYQPLQIVLRNVLIKNIQLDATADLEDFAVGNQKKAELVKYCMIVVSSAPLIAIYPFLQKYFAKGAMIGSLKG